MDNFGKAANCDKSKGLEYFSNDNSTKKRHPCFSVPELDYLGGNLNDISVQSMLAHLFKQGSERSVMLNSQ